MRAVKTTKGSVWKQGHYGPTTTLTFRDKTGEHTVEIGAGSADYLYVYREHDLTFVVCINYGLPYCGLEVFQGSERVGDVFLQESHVEETLGVTGVKLAPFTIAKRLAEYALC